MKYVPQKSKKISTPSSSGVTPYRTELFKITAFKNSFLRQIMDIIVFKGGL
jgi:hypothetical protein